MGQELVTVAALALTAVLVGLAVRRWLIFVTQVDSVSMVPALLPGRRLVTRRQWRPGRIRRGDILVVDSQELGRTVVKRVVGLPGERVVIEPGGRISYYQFATRMTTPIATLANEPSTFTPGLTLSPDGRWLLYGQMDRSGADIMLVENFQ